MTDMPPIYPPGEWRANVLHDPADFCRGQVQVMLGLSTAAGLRLAAQAPVVLSEPYEAYVAQEEQPEPFVILPTEAAEVLFQALAVHFLGTSDVLRLSRDLAAERKRVDALIAGIGRMGSSSPTSLPRDARGG